MDINQTIDEEVIVVGDKVDIVTQTGLVYRTMIEDMESNGLFLAGVPQRKGQYMNASRDDDLYLVFYRDSGRFIAHMKVVALENRGQLRYMWIMQKTRAQKNQRREAFRLQVSFDVQIFEFNENIEQGIHLVKSDEGNKALESVNSRDISVTGIALLTKRKYELEDKYMLSLHLNRAPATMGRKPLDEAPALHLTAMVKRCIPWRTSNTYNTGMQFFGMTEAMSDGIAKYVLSEQQKQIKRRRRVF